MPDFVAYSIIKPSISVGTKDVASSKTAYYSAKLGFPGQIEDYDDLPWGYGRIA